MLPSRKRKYIDSKLNKKKSTYLKYLGSFDDTTFILQRGEKELISITGRYKYLADIIKFSRRYSFEHNDGKTLKHEYNKYSPNSYVEFKFCDYDGMKITDHLILLGSFYYKENIRQHILQDSKQNIISMDFSEENFELFVKYVRKQPDRNNIKQLYDMYEEWVLLNPNDSPLFTVRPYHFGDKIITDYLTYTVSFSDGTHVIQGDNKFVFFINCNEQEFEWFATYLAKNCTKEIFVQSKGKVVYDIYNQWSTIKESQK